MKRRVFIVSVPIIIIAILGAVLLAWSTGATPRISAGIEDSERFVKVIENEDVSAWINGHIHSNHEKEDTRVDKWGTTFIDAGSIHDVKALFGDKRYSESLFMVFENGSKEVVVRSRNHSKREWNKNLENKFSFRLNSPFNYHKENLKVQIFCDVQPETEKQWKIFENSLDDSKNAMDANAYLFLGDAVNHGAEKDFEKFVKYLENSHIPLENFYALAGNHDFSPYMTGDLSNYENYIVEKTETKEKIKYTIDIGNVEFLLLGDEKPGVGTEIGENTFDWWRKKLEKAPENINQITLTHAPVVGTVAGSEIEDYLSGKQLFFVIIGIIIILGIGLIISTEVS